MTTYATARSVRLGVAEMIRPPRRIRVSEGARVLQVANAAGAAGGWDPDTTPYMVEPLDTTGSRHYEAVVFVGPARSGKTISLIDARLAYLITCNPADAMVVQMSKDAAEDYSKTRISRSISASPELRSRLSPRAHDDNILLKFFRSGMSLRMGWPSVSVLSGKDIHDVLMTDVDNYTGDLAIDECFGLALKRTQTYMSAGMVVAESSPATDYTDGAWKPQHPHQGPPAAGIAALYARGDRAVGTGRAPSAANASRRRQATTALRFHRWTNCSSGSCWMTCRRWRATTRCCIAPTVGLA